MIPSFVLVIRNFNNTTLEPRELPIVVESKEDMEKLDRDDREGLIDQETHGKSLFYSKGLMLILYLLTKVVSTTLWCFLSNFVLLRRN